MLTSVCTLMFRQQSGHASLLFVRFVECGVSSQDTPCYRWCVQLSLARSITVTQFWPEFPETSYAGYSPSWTPLHVSCSRRRDLTTSRRYSANYIGSRFQRGSSFGSVCSSTGACITQHRHTSPSHCNWPVMCMPDDVSALLNPWSWSYLRCVVQRWVIERSRCQLHGHGMPCYLPSELHHHSPRSGRDSNKHFSCNLFLTNNSVFVQCPSNSYITVIASL